MVPSTQKTYADSGVQTSSDSSSSSSLCSNTQSQFVPARTFPNSLSTPSHSCYSTASAENRLPNAVFDQDGVLPQIRLQHGQRSKPSKPQLPYNRPSNFHNDLISQMRAVSLPERLAFDVITDQLAPTFLSTPRSISMPASYPSQLQASALSNSSDMSTSVQGSSSFSTDGAEYTPVRISPRVAKVPYTPSPPSSPDSVEIIENIVRLPEAFLRCSRHRSHTPDNEGWVTWANSPPRPIPALHGPASLPYARCPSGAEGTLIEEQSNVPGLIWGLNEDETTHAGHSRSMSMMTAVSSNNRCGRSPQHHRSMSGPQNAGSTNMQALDGHVTSSQKTAGNTQFDIFQHPGSCNAGLKLKGLRLPMKDRTNDSDYVQSASTERKLHDFTSRAVNAGINARLAHVNDNREISLPHIEHELELARIEHEMNTRFELEEALSHHHQNVRIKAAQNGGENQEQKNMMAYLKATAPTFVPSHLRETPSSARHVSQSPLLSQNTENLHPRNHFSSKDRRVSAGNRSQPPRPRSQQYFLPTPPDSSSPLWSSNFLPYPIDLYSPEAPSASYSNRKAKTLPPERRSDVDQLEELSHQLRRFVYDRMSLDGCNVDHHSDAHADTALAPSARIHSASAEPRSQLPPVASRSPRFPIPIYPANAVPSSMTASPSVVQLGPPNIPLPPTPVPALASQHPKSNSVVHKMYPSPTSPADRLLSSRDFNLVRQRPRSIPLARLIERRLASVPEEETSNISARIDEVTATQTIEKPTRLIPSPLSLADPFSSTLNLHSLTEDSTFTNEPNQITVKLPSAGLKVPKPTTHTLDANDREDKESSTKRKRTRGKKNSVPSSGRVKPVIAPSQVTV